MCRTTGRPGDRFEARRMTLSSTLRVLAAFALGAVPLAAVAQSPAPGPPPKPCSSSQDRQFDFWLGRWTVTDPAGKPQGTNAITRELRGCVLQEHWAGTAGERGTSFNHYDAARKHWHQTWVDDGGGILLLDGGRRGASMVLAGTRPARRGGTVTDRITFTPRADGSVRQWWQSSRDGGATWTTTFDGIYRRSS
jgi:hypothetical protein